ncbi:hypothetical protein ZOSMA_61G00160 [Zostera marina]|uniref:Retrotransposon gag domain-containing protein n=1 Tax=Zostera marina TaxID=29655 RepID=A0A0K9NVM6_ZOSMR|nr:hypothetical protein ZOSMA_61G00160 [Zostera marina]
MGTESLDEVDNWVDTVETSFEMLDVPEEKKAIFDTYLLCEYAKDWWKGKKILKFAGATMISWEEFHQEFEIEFRPRHLIEEAQEKFRDLVQGTKTVMEYANKFVRLEKYFPTL